MMNNRNCFLAKLCALLFGCYALDVSAGSNPTNQDYVKSTMIGQAVRGGVVFLNYLSAGVVHGLVAATADEPGGAFVRLIQCSRTVTSSGITVLA